MEKPMFPDWHDFPDNNRPNGTYEDIPSIQTLPKEEHTETSYLCVQPITALRRVNHELVVEILSVDWSYRYDYGKNDAGGHYECTLIAPKPMDSESTASGTILKDETLDDVIQLLTDARAYIASLNQGSQ
jgi:hypothetical protein